MAPPRPPIPSGGSLDGPLIPGRPANLTVSVVVPTRPEAHLRSGDRRRLARAVSGAERRLARTEAPSEGRRRLVRRLWDLAADASRSPARQGLALVASADAGRVLPLHYPVTERILVGPAPTYEQLVEQSWGFARLAVLLITGRGARLLACDGGAPWEPEPPSPPFDEPLSTVHDVLSRADMLVRTTVPPRTPLVIAGHDRMVRSFLQVHGNTARPAWVLAGDHSETSPATLITLAKRTLRTSLVHEQREAMVSLVLAVERGTAWRGPDPRLVGRVDQGQVLLVEERVAATAEVASRPRSPHRGAVVVVPDGFLAHHDGAALVPDHRHAVRDAPAETSEEPDIHEELWRLTLLGTGAPC